MDSGSDPQRARVTYIITRAMDDLQSGPAQHTRNRPKAEIIQRERTGDGRCFSEDEQRNTHLGPDALFIFLHQEGGWKEKERPRKSDRGLESDQ